MSRGVVLRLDAEGDRQVRELWSELEAAGVATLSTHTHRRHEPHVSLVVGERLERSPRPVPTPALRFAAVGVFPGGVLFLAVVPTRELLDLQRVLHEELSDALVDPWPVMGPDQWSPHLTLAHAVPGDRLGTAVAQAAQLLPLACGTALWVEDGTSGEAWPV